MLRRLLFLVLALVGIFWWFRRRTSSGRRPAQPGRPPAPAAGGGEMVRDRVCNTFLPRSRALTLKVGSGQEFFCSEKCRQAFQDRARASG